MKSKLVLKYNQIAVTSRKELTIYYFNHSYAISFKSAELVGSPVFHMVKYL